MPDENYGFDAACETGPAAPELRRRCAWLHHGQGPDGPTEYKFVARSVALRAGSPRIVPRQTTGGPRPDAALAQETNDERLTTKAPYKFGGIRRQRDGADIGWHDEVARPVPSGAVKHEHDVPVCCDGRGEAVQKDLHGCGGDLGQHEGKAPAAGRVNGAEQVSPLVALLAQAARALAAHPPAVAGAALRADPALVLEPQLDALVGMCRCHGLYGPQKPPLVKAAWARSSASGCCGRVFCRDRSRRRRMRDRLAGCRRLPKRSSIQRHRAGSVQSVQP